MKPDLIIAGQGICGSLLSWALMQKGMKVQVYDAGIEHAAAFAASGIINPITGKRFVKSWMIDELLPSALQMYRAIGMQLSASFYEAIPVYKLLESVKEQNDFGARASEPGYEGYFKSNEVEYLDAGKVQNPFGAFVIRQSGKLDTRAFLIQYREYLRSLQALQEENISWQTAIDSKIPVIMCSGYLLSKEGLFTTLPWQVVKGEYLLVKIDNFYTDRIISGDKGLAPTSIPSVYYAGATYQWHYETTAPTRQYKMEIISGLEKMLRVPFEVLEHGAGIRPATKYRRPFLGFHPQYSHIGIFGGMGTKGMSLTPWFAEHFAVHITEGKALLPDTDITKLCLPSTADTE